MATDLSTEELFMRLRAPLVVLGMFFGCTVRAFAAAEPQATNSPSPPPWLSPFCPVSVAATPWDASANIPASDPASTALGLRLFAESGTVVDAHVTLISDSSAYDVYVRGTALSGEAYRHESKQLMVLLPDRTAIHYAYIDSYALDGSGLTPCATMVSFVQVWRPAFAGDRLESPDPKGAISATYRQALPALPCGKVYTPARVVKVGRRVKPGAYGNSRLLAEVRIYLDSNGKLMKAYVYKSSGVQGVDSYALYMAEASTYAPATFLCTPVVSDYLFKLDYGP